MAAQSSPDTRRQYGGAAAPPPQPWNFVGFAWDLVKRTPVHGVRIRFVDDDRHVHAAAVSDEKGRFEAKLPARAGGYQLEIEHEDYRPVYVDDTSPSILLAPDEQRLQLGETAGRNRPWDAAGASGARYILLLPRSD